MNKDKRLDQVRQIAVDDRDAVAMLLSACADMAHGDGLLLSGKKFEEAADYIVSYLNPPQQYRTPLIERSLVEETAVADTSSCCWVDKDDYWETSCGKHWLFTCDGPTENGMNYCHNCGRPLVEETAVTQQEER